jgi:hypothetical protein
MTNGKGFGKERSQSISDTISALVWRVKVEAEVFLCLINTTPRYEGVWAVEV